MSLLGGIFAGGQLFALLGLAALASPVALRRPELTIAAFVVASVFSWTWVGWLETAANLVYWATALALALAFLVRASTSGVARRWLLTAAMATAAIGASAAWSIAPSTTVSETVKFGVILGVAAFAGTLVHESAAAGEVLARLLALIVPAVVAATVVVVTIGFWDEELANDGGISAIFSGPNVFGACVVLALPFLLIQRPVSRSAVVAVGTVAAAAFAITVSGSRTGLAGLVAAVAVMEAGRRRWRRLAASLSAVAAAFVLTAVASPSVPTLGAPIYRKAQASDEPSRRIAPAQNEVLLGSQRPADQSRLSALLGARDEGWREAARIYGHRPLAGHGFGTGPLLFERYGSQERFKYFVGAFAVNTSAHNGYLQTLLELGSAGGLLLLAALLVLVWSVVRALKAGWSDAAESAFGGCIAAALVVAIFESTFAQAGPLTVVSWLAAAGLAGAGLRSGEAFLPLRLRSPRARRIVRAPYAQRP